jgi:hypothetical protein
MTKTTRLGIAERGENDHAPRPTIRALAEQQQQNSTFNHVSRAQ